MRGREITEFGDLGCHVAELYSLSLTLTWGNYQNPLVLRQDGDYKALALSLSFLHAGTRWKWLTRWAASLWLPTVDLSGQHGMDWRLSICVCVSEWVSVFIFLVSECISVIKRSGWKAFGAGAWSKWREDRDRECEQQISLGWWRRVSECNGHICLPLHTHNPGNRTWSLQAAIHGWGYAAPSHVTYLTWQQIQQCSARDFWKQALCRLHAMFICNQTKVNGRILPCNTTKQGFITLTPSGFMDAISTHHMTALSANFPSAMSHAAPSYYIL